jgi:hypothetical protein
MDEKTPFIVYCLEEFKSAEQLSGKAAIELFNRHGVVDYIKNAPLAGGQGPGPRKFFRTAG